MKRAGCILANFDFDQAEGLRRMLAGPQPRVMTFLSATPQDDKGAMLVNLGASLAYGGNEVLLVDASGGSDGVAARLGLAHGASLRDVARQQCALNQVIHQVPQGFGVASLGADAALLPIEAVAQQLVAHADQALYQAKREGRNCVRQWLES